MTRGFTLGTFLLLALSTHVAVGQDDLKAPETLQDKASYGIGLTIGGNLKSDGLQVSVKYLARGILDAMTGKKPLIDPEVAKKAIEPFAREMAAKVAADNKTAGAKFLAENKKQPGVITLPSGLQYKVLKKGNGPSPKATSTVSTHYHGTLLDGTVFDSSVRRGEPAQFPVNRVIAGWTEALQKMKVGDKWILYVPSDMAYGANPPPQSSIGPNSTLVFEVELLQIVQ